MPPTNLSYAQSEPVRQGQGRQLFRSHAPKDAHIPTADDPRGNSSVDYRPTQQPHLVRQHFRHIEDDVVQMPPPPPPQSISGDPRQGQLRQRSSFALPSTPRLPQEDRSHHQRLSSVPPGEEDFRAPTSFRSATPALQTQRFTPSVPSTPSGHQRFSASSSSAASSSGFASGLLRGNRDTNPKFRAPSNATSSGQRLPFMPSGQGA